MRTHQIPLFQVCCGIFIGQCAGVYFALKPRQSLAKLVDSAIQLLVRGVHSVLVLALFGGFLPVHNTTCRYRADVAVFLSTEGMQDLVHASTDPRIHYKFPPKPLRAANLRTHGFQQEIFPEKQPMYLRVAQQ